MIVGESQRGDQAQGDLAIVSNRLDFAPSEAEDCHFRLVENGRNLMKEDAKNAINKAQFHEISLNTDRLIRVAELCG